MTHHFQLHFNIAAPPFKPPPNYNAYPTIRIGPSKLPVNGKIWDTIANDRILPALPKTSRVGSALLTSMSLPTPAHPPSFFNSSNLFGGYVSMNMKKILQVMLHNLIFCRLIRLRSKKTTRATLSSLATSDPSPIPRDTSNCVCAKTSGERPLT